MAEERWTTFRWTIGPITLWPTTLRSRVELDKWVARNSIYTKALIYVLDWTSKLVLKELSFYWPKSRFLYIVHCTYQFSNKISYWFFNCTNMNKRKKTRNLIFRARNFWTTTSGTGRWAQPSPTTSGGTLPSSGSSWASSRRPSRPTTTWSDPWRWKVHIFLFVKQDIDFKYLYIKGGGRGVSRKVPSPLSKVIPLSMDFNIQFLIFFLRHFCEKYFPVCTV